MTDQAFPSLLPDERVLWQGEPRQGLRLTWWDAFIIPFSLLWTSVPFFGTIAMATGTDSVDPIGLLVFPVFLVIGCYLLLGRFFVDRAIRRQTRYALTTRRAIIRSGLFRAAEKSVSLASVSGIEFDEGRNGRGTIRFGSNPFAGFMPPGWPGASRFTAPMFDDIVDARHVYAQALSAQRHGQDNGR